MLLDKAQPRPEPRVVYLFQPFSSSVYLVHVRGCLNSHSFHAVTLVFLMCDVVLTDIEVAIFCNTCVPAVEVLTS